MAFVTVEDLVGTIECVCFPKVYDKIKSFLTADKVVSVVGKISISQDKAPAIVVDKMTEFSLKEDGAQTTHTPMQTGEERERAEKDESKFAQEAKKESRLWLNVSGLEEADLEELLETLTYYEGEIPVIFVNGKQKMLCSQKINPCKALFAELAGFLPENCIKLV